MPAEQVKSNRVSRVTRGKLDRGKARAAESSTFQAYCTGDPNSQIGENELVYLPFPDPRGSCLLVMQMWHTYRICYRLQVKHRLSSCMTDLCLDTIFKNRFLDNCSCMYLSSVMFDSFLAQKLQGQHTSLTADITQNHYFQRKPIPVNPNT